MNRKVIVCTLISAALAVAQTRPVDESPTPGTWVEILTANLLASQNETDLAWGVYFTGRLHLRRFEPEIRTLFDAKTAALKGDAGPGPLMQAVLDVLIEMRMPVPWEDLEQWFRNFPDEVIVLMARNPAANEAPLLEWFDEDIPHSRWLAIGNLLAEHRTPGFALRILRDLEVTVAVTVGSGFGAGSGGGMSACGGCRPLAPLPGYPPIGYYKLTRQLILGSALVAGGPTPIYVERGITSQHHVCWVSGSARKAQILGEPGDGK